MLALESRRAQEIGKLITNWGGEPIIAPSVKEVPLEANSEALEFVRRLEAKQVDIVIFTTGVGVKALAAAIEAECPRDKFAFLLNGVTIVARGPKPTAALREFGIRVTLPVPEPNTWRDMLAVLDARASDFPLAGRQVAIQEYGVANPELTFGLQQRGASVLPVVIYQWALPDDTAPLQHAVDAVVRGEIHVLLVASSAQIRHFFLVAQAMGREEALREHLSQVVIASIGPLTSAELRSRGLNVDIECTRPKMGYLVQEAAENTDAILQQKRGYGPHATGGP